MLTVIQKTVNQLQPTSQEDHSQAAKSCANSATLSPFLKLKPVNATKELARILGA
jgi:hypothetical protein